MKVKIRFLHKYNIELKKGHILILLHQFVNMSTSDGDGLLWRRDGRSSLSTPESGCGVLSFSSSVSSFSLLRSICRGTGSDPSYNAARPASTSPLSQKVVTFYSTPIFTPSFSPFQTTDLLKGIYLYLGRF